MSLGRGKKTLKPGTLPSIFSFKRKASPPRRNSPKKRLISSPQPEKLSPQNNKLLAEVDKHEREVNILKTQIEDLQCENIFLKEEVTTIKSKFYRQSYSYENISQDPTLFKSETGLSKERFEELYTVLDPGENCVNIKYYESKSITSDTEKLQKSPTSNKKQEPKVIL